MLLYIQLLAVKIIVTFIAVGASLLLSGLLTTGFMAESNDTNNITPEELAALALPGYEYPSPVSVVETLETGLPEPP